MSSGIRSIQINTQERIVSPDMNRAQAFLGAGLGEVLRYMMNATCNDDLDAGGVLVEYSALESPLRAEVIGGLLVRPQTSSLNLSVDKGLLLALNPSGSADDSNYRYVSDAGVVAGALTMTSNLSGSARVDVIECQVNATDALVTDNRDIFDPTTGLFVAQTVTKERRAQLAYRVRLGTPGAGFPGTVSGWLPLAVALVPNGAIIVNSMTFWDVRPLINDRESTPFAMARDVPRPATSMSVWNPVTQSATNYPLTGTHEVALNGRRLGGRWRRGSPGADADNVDLTNAANQEAAFVPVAGTLVHAYLCAPYGLPRWARYTATAPQLPRSPRGIVLLSNIAPTERGIASSNIAPPSAIGLALPFEASNCVHVGCASYADTGGTGVIFSGFQRNDSLCYPLAWSNRQNAIAGNNLRVVGSGSPAFDNAHFQLLAGTHFPRNARSIFASFEIQSGITWTAGGEYGKVFVFEPGSSTNIAVGYTVSAHKDGTTGRMTADFEIPLPTPYPGVWGSSQYVEFQYGGSSGTPAAMILYINGWRL